jgi:hypothetical protein
MLVLHKKSIILILLAGVIIFICFYSQIENFFVFHPQTKLDETPDRMGLRHESITFKAADGTKLHGWFFPLSAKSPGHSFLSRQCR